MEPKDQAPPITLCKARNIFLWIPLPSFIKSLIWVVGEQQTLEYVLYASKPRVGAFTWFALLYIWRCSVFFHHVLPKMAETFAREITLTTLEGLFSRVFTHVYIQRTSLSARMIALIAFAGLLSSVSALVFFHMRSSSA